MLAVFHDEAQHPGACGGEEADHAAFTAVAFGIGTCRDRLRPRAATHARGTHK